MGTAMKTQLCVLIFDKPYETGQTEEELQWFRDELKEGNRLRYEHYKNFLFKNILSNYNN